jgi:Spy/CpxP family protein refolding chaperone
MRVMLPLALTLTLGAPALADRLHDAGVAALKSQAQLDDTDAARVQTIVDKYRGRIDPLRRDDVELVHALEAQVRGTPDEREVKRLEKRLLENRQKLRELRADRVKEIQKSLAPAAFARVLVAWPAIDRAVHREARRPRG